MKVQGITVKAPDPIEFKVIRGDDTIIFKAGPVLSYKRFDELCPEPKVPIGIKPGDIKVPHPEDPEYLKAVDEHNERRYQFLILTSLSATDELEWDTVNLDDPETWKNWDEEFASSGITRHEVNELVSVITRAQGMDDLRFDEARKGFSPGQEEEKV